MEINIPDVLDEVRQIFALYEQCLVDADGATLDRLFWRSPHTMRYGPDEILSGHAAIAAFNARRVPQPDRQLRDTVITTYGRDFATVSTLYLDVPPGRIGRQMQSWARLPDGWHVVAAHVSVIDKPDMI